jgi:hypothetical protein
VISVFRLRVVFLLSVAVYALSSAADSLPAQFSKFYFRPRNRMRPVNARPRTPLNVKNSGESILLLTTVGFDRAVILLNPPRKAH